jgi:HlyD family secretion protein
VTQKAATPSELEQNKLQLTQAEADVQASEKAKQTLDQQAQLDQGRVGLQVEHARASVRDLEDRLDFARGRAPSDGTLYSFPIHQGDFVKAGDLLAEMANLHQLRIRAFIDEPELGQIDLDQTVEILWDAHPGQIWNGRTEALPKQVVTRGTRNVGELLCSVTNERLDLLPNTTVDVRIHISERPSALVVPRGAVFIDGDKRFVYRVEDNRLHRRLIKVGIANPTKMEVLSGLNENDVVALPGEAVLKENLRIVPVRQE